MSPKASGSWFLARIRGASLCACIGFAGGCGPSEKVTVIHPREGRAAKNLFRVAFTQQITLPDNFVLRPDEFAAVTVDHERGLLYVGSRDGSLLALDEDTGQVVWEESLTGAVSSKPTLADLPGDEPRKNALLLVGTDNGALIAYDLEKSEELWRYETDGKVRQAPVVHEGVVYFVNSRDQMFALDVRTGTWRWQYEQELQTDFTINGRAGITFVPAPTGAVGEVGTLYTGFANGRVVAVGAASGEALWVTSVAPPDGGNFIDCDSTPLVDLERRELYVSGQQTGVYALSLDDGSVKWRYDVRGAGSVVRGRGEDLIVASSLEGMLSLDREGRFLWRTQVDPGVLSEPLTVADTVYVTHSDSGLLAFEADTGRLLAKIDLGSGMSSVPVYDALTDRFYATTNRGLLLGLQIERGEPDVPEPTQGSGFALPPPPS